ncbi:hypothetical protein Bp8pC_193 [Bacillus phage Bp8p-C]|uniref:Uncharacterized protein n=2 Tax=Agatevirus Bp8pC TaxID=1910937 RepID=A0A0A0PJE9_9CAUD|nr:hypothetical protein AXJ20_gp155 [Bacillus phage Bp8p-C]YP_009784493.1 hypothetical protein QLX39_gp155 [Bacillus phage Bp8p-T]AHJ87623.1 hypothetical protein Bp8pC_193 [Bacillus phage Bp8p-C]AHJ87834.1 hypothetical protein Bp8pT_193 [Bacillus phage Bp8p-T]
MTEKKVLEEVKAYLLENEEELQAAVREVISWNGELDHYDWYVNDEEFFNMFFEGKTDEVVRAVCFGDFNYGDDYVRFNAYGNLETANEYTIIKEMKDDIEDIADAVIRNIDNIDVSDELVSIIEQIEDEEDEE